MLVKYMQISPTTSDFRFLSENLLTMPSNRYGHFNFKTFRCYVNDV